MASTPNTLPTITVEELKVTCTSDLVKVVCAMLDHANRSVQCRQIVAAAIWRAHSVVDLWCNDPTIETYSRPVLSGLIKDISDLIRYDGGGAQTITNVSNVLTNAHKTITVWRPPT